MKVKPVHGAGADEPPFAYKVPAESSKARGRAAQPGARLALEVP